MSFLHKNVVNLNISYKLDTWSRDLNTYFVFGNCMLEAVKLTNNADRDKYGYRGYGIAFDLRSQFSWSDGSWSQNLIIFGADVSSSVHVDNKKKDILVADEGGLDDTTITAEAKYSINFTESGKIFVLSLHYNGRNSFLFVNAEKMYQFIAKYSETKPYSLCKTIFTQKILHSITRKKQS